MASAPSNKLIRIWDIRFLANTKPINKEEIAVRPSKILRVHNNSIRRLLKLPENKLMISVAFERLIYI